MNHVIQMQECINNNNYKYKQLEGEPVWNAVIKTLGRRGNTITNVDPKVFITAFVAPYNSTCLLELDQLHRCRYISGSWKSGVKLSCPGENSPFLVTVY